MASAYKTEEDTIQKALRVYEERKRENLKVNLKKSQRIQHVIFQNNSQAPEKTLENQPPSYEPAPR
jgi:hypothetical protein